MEEHGNRVKRIYSGIRQRCNNKNHPSFKYYGGKGVKCLVTVDELKEMWERDGAASMKRPSVDRIDSNGDYVYPNLRWLELSDNTRRAHLLGDVKMTQSQRDARRDTTHIRLGRDIINLMKKDAKKEKKTIQQVMEAILRTAFKAPK